MKNKYVFILTIAIVCSLLLSLASEGLKERRNKNVEIDIKKNILNAIGVNIDSFSILDIDKYFTDNIDTLVIDIKGNISNLSINDLNMIENKQTGEVKYFNDNQEYLPLYNEIEKNIIIIPVSGKGLWSSLFGYFAIDANNYSTVKGIAFYAHGETPGLGAEISSEWFQLSFVGKEIYSGKELLSIKLTKPGLADKDNLYEVNGISGATITSNGVTTLLKRDLRRYEPYFKNVVRINEK
tara:strand:+ start:203 stop:919 length:717 start_codon:yes stop_codon:yes gene_type:complete